MRSRVGEPALHAAYEPEGRDHSNTGAVRENGIR
jgi:hypothetical protein